MNAIITVVGSDKVGIIAKVSAFLSEHSINIADITQSGQLLRSHARLAGDLHVAEQELHHAGYPGQPAVLQHRDGQRRSEARLRDDG